MVYIYRSKERGIIKGLILLTLAICGLFLILALFSKSISDGGLLDGIVKGATETDSTTEVRVNPLLDFGGQYAEDDRFVTNGPTGTKDPNASPYAGKVTMSQGSASYSIQPIEEYVELRNSGEPVSITGWKLENGKGSRPIQNSSNSYFYPTPESAIIGQGTEFLDPSGSFKVGPIVLKNGDKAIVTTGGPFAQFSFSINTNFRENICLGFLKNYPFEPRVYGLCPYINQDKDIRTVTTECYDYIATLGRCENPEYDNKAKFDVQPSHCKTFIRERQSYPACVRRNQNENNFSQNQWRIFLGKKSELWARKLEIITLYDAQGLIVDQIKY